MHYTSLEIAMSLFCDTLVCISQNLSLGCLLNAIIFALSRLHNLLSAVIFPFNNCLHLNVFHTHRSLFAVLVSLNEIKNDWHLLKKTKAKINLFWITNTK